MSDNLVLERLREIRGVLDGFRADNPDLKHRVSTLESQLGNVQTTEQNHHASLSVRLDRMASDVARIKQRLAIVDVPAE